MQDALGRLNDMQVHNSVARDIAHGGAAAGRTDRALAMGFVLGRERKGLVPCMEAVVKSVRRLRRTPPFWE